MSGFRTLLYKEVLRFWKVGFQTVAAPVLTALLYLLIFAQVLESRVEINELPYTAFLIPGLIMMAVLQNSFANSSSSLIQAKVTGSIIFVLLPPISYGEFFLAYVGAAVLRGMMVSLGVLAVTVWFAPLQFAAPLWILAFALNGGGIIHRGGTGESILLFANHRHFLDFAGTAEDWKRVIASLRAGAPEKKIIVEADTYRQALAILEAEPDIIQLDKCSPPVVAQVVEVRDRCSRTCMISAAGGLTKDNAPSYAAAGAQLLVSSAPYYAGPVDVTVILKP